MFRAHRAVVGGCWLAAVLSVRPSGVATAQDPAPRPAPAPSKVVGTVTDTAGLPLSGARVSVLTTALHTISDDSGRFRLEGIPSGNVVFSVRRLGYEAATFTASLRPGRTHGVTLPLTALAQALPEVAVEQAREPSAWLALFEKRRTTNRGTFFTRKDIEHRQARTASDLMRTVPGVQVVRTRTGEGLVMTRGNGARRCYPQLYVHTTPYSGSIDDFSADDIEAMEVYSGISEVPPDLNTVGRPICAAVVIWTREPPPRTRKVAPSPAAPRPPERTPPLSTRA